MQLFILGMLSWVCCADAEAGKADLEAVVKAAYSDKGLVTQKTVEVKGETVEYLEAGEQGERTVIFCHGSAFTMRTWQWVGVLDALASNYRAIALNLPGYGATKRTRNRENFVREFLDVLEIDKKVVVVAASMGGTYGLPFVVENKNRAAGYVSAAGLLGRDATDVPTLFIYGDQDPRLNRDSRSAFPNQDLVVFKDAPHPCYLRDLDAAKQFVSLVLNFCEDSGSDIGVHADWGTSSGGHSTEK